jgi:hypothetical protein
MSEEKSLYNDLIEHGFVVIPNFLNTNDLIFLVKEYMKSKSAITLSPGDLIFHDIPEFVVRALEPKLRSVIDQSPIPADTVVPGGLFTDTTLMNLDWHQDHGTYIFSRNHYNVLKFYIPIAKPDVNKSGLSLLSYKTIAEHDPEGARRLINNGATRFFPEGKQTRIIEDILDQEWILNVNIEDIKISPAIGPGDLLLCRGDIIHRTQDCDTHRVAVAFHSLDGNIKISIDNFNPTTPAMEDIFKTNQDLITGLKNRFNRIGKDEMNMYEWYKFEN